MSSTLIELDYPIANPSTKARTKGDAVAEYMRALVAHNALRNAAARMGWHRRALAFGLSASDRHRVLHDGLGASGNRQAREDFKRLSRKL